MKPHQPTGPFADTINWKHFWYCMKYPTAHPYMQPKPPEGKIYFNPIPPASPVTDIDFYRLSPDAQTALIKQRKRA